MKTKKKGPAPHGVKQALEWVIVYQGDCPRDTLGSLNLTLMLVLIQVVDANNRRKND